MCVNAGMVHSIRRRLGQRDRLGFGESECSPSVSLRRSWSMLVSWSHSISSWHEEWKSKKMYGVAVMQGHYWSSASSASMLSTHALENSCVLFLYRSLSVPPAASFQHWHYGAQSDYTHIVIVWGPISQLYRTSVKQGLLAGILLCNLGASLRYSRWTSITHTSSLRNNYPIAHICYTKEQFPNHLCNRFGRNLQSILPSLSLEPWQTHCTAIARKLRGAIIRDKDC